MKAVDVLAAVLVIVGALNWGLVGVAKFNLVAALFGQTAWIESKHDPSLIARNENPPLLSRRVRTQPLMVTSSFSPGFPARACATDTSAMRCSSECDRGATGCKRLTASGPHVHRCKRNHPASGFPGIVAGIAPPPVMVVG